MVVRLARRRGSASSFGAPGCAGTCARCITGALGCLFCSAARQHLRVPFPGVPDVLPAPFTAFAPATVAPAPRYLQPAGYLLPVRLAPCACCRLRDHCLLLDVPDPCALLPAYLC